MFQKRLRYDKGERTYEHGLEVSGDSVAVDAVAYVVHHPHKLGVLDLKGSRVK